MKATLRVAIVFVLAAAALCAQDLTDRGAPRIYSGDHLEAVGMPVGGVGTGNIWIAGDGSLSVWQIFNNVNETGHVPDTFLAMRMKEEGEEPVLYALEEKEHEGFLPLKVKSFQGNYPFAWLTYRDGDMPVEVTLEVFNPMIPLNLGDSSIPCALFRLYANNVGDKPVEVSFAAMLQNAVGYNGRGKIEGRKYWGYGGNKNVYKRSKGYAKVRLNVPDDDGWVLDSPITILCNGPEDRALAYCKNLNLLGLPSRGPIPPADVYWIKDIGSDSNPRVWDVVARVEKEGGLLLLDQPAHDFFKLMDSIRKGREQKHVVFEDFESGSYEKWIVEGEAFGDKPHTGTTPGQNPVSGFKGTGLVNSFIPNDGPQGVMTSKPFRISHYYIGFLVGGGAHKGATCINLKVDGEVVRTATGKWSEHLEPHVWDVMEWEGREAVIEIVDKASGRWGHINVDHIVFSDIPPAAILGNKDAQESLAKALPFGSDYQKLRSRHYSEKGWEAIKSYREKSPRQNSHSLKGPEYEETYPHQVRGPYGKGEIIILFPYRKEKIYHKGFIDRGPPGSALWLSFTPSEEGDFHPFDFGFGFSPLEVIGSSKKIEILHTGSGIPPHAATYGDMTLCVLSDEATACADWADSKALAEDLLDDGRLGGPEASKESPLGETKNCALAVPFTLMPGDSRPMDFAITWCFPNFERYGHEGNFYAKAFPDADVAADYVCRNYDRLRDETMRFHDTLYETNLPYWMIDCLSANACIHRTVLCFFAARHAETGKPYFAGYEGSNGCCPLNCTHVWNYAQTHARLFPEIGRNLRWYDFNHYLKEDGESQHRQHRPHGAFIDGHCAIIEGACREYLMSPDRKFLEEIWPGVKKAVEWLIRKIDSDEDGVNAGHQWNTYDVATGGAHTFIGSQYLSALAAGRKMAMAMGEEETAKRWDRIRESGMKNQDELLWNGEYYIQIPDEKPARDYNTGCHSDQLLGQWWTYMLDGGRLYPKEHVECALRSIFEYNHRNDFSGFNQRPRRYVIDEEGGLLMCTWPKGGRPDPFILYADEVWTGIEYATAALMIYEGMIDEAFHIVHTARGRYDGMLREGLNSGPGGNPFNELECGGFYARAQSSWSLLLACQGFIYEGPKKTIGFLPRWRPEDHKSFFCAAEGWGLFTQRRGSDQLTATIEVRYGKLPVKNLVLDQNYHDVWCVFRGRTAPVRSAVTEGGRVFLSLEKEIEIQAGETLTILTKGL